MPPEPLIIYQGIGAEKDKKIISLSAHDPEKHSAGHRLAESEGLPRSEEGAYLLTRACSGLAPAPGSDRRKYLVADQHVDRAIDACLCGVPEVRIARSLGINYRTRMRVRDEDECVAIALSESRKVEEEELVTLLLDKARQGETTSLIFALKSRHGYRDQDTPQAAGYQRELSHQLACCMSIRRRIRPNQRPERDALTGEVIEPMPHQARVLDVPESMDLFFGAGAVAARAIARAC